MFKAGEKKDANIILSYCIWVPTFYRFLIGILLFNQEKGIRKENICIMERGRKR